MEEDCKDTKKPTCSRQACGIELDVPPGGSGSKNTRFPEFLYGIFWNKGVRWMPRLKKAMKDVAWLR